MKTGLPSLGSPGLDTNPADPRAPEKGSAGLPLARYRAGSLFINSLFQHLHDDPTVLRTTLARGVVRDRLVFAEAIDRDAVQRDAVRLI